MSTVEESFEDVRLLVERLREAAVAGLASRGRARESLAVFDATRTEIDATLGPVRRRLARAVDADLLDTVDERRKPSSRSGTPDRGGGGEPGAL